MQQCLRLHFNCSSFLWKFKKNNVDLLSLNITHTLLGDEITVCLSVVFSRYIMHQTIVRQSIVFSYYYYFFFFLLYFPCQTFVCFTRQFICLKQTHTEVVSKICSVFISVLTALLCNTYYFSLNVQDVKVFCKF
jgi:uncharacterized membrane protein